MSASTTTEKSGTLTGGPSIKAQVKTMRTEIKTHLEKILKKYTAIVLTALAAFVFGTLLTIIWDLNSKISGLTGQSLYIERVYKTEQDLLEQKIENARLNKVVLCLKNNKIINKSVCDYVN